MAKLFASCVVAILQRPDDNSNNNGGDGGDEQQSGQQSMIVSTEDTWLAELMKGRVLEIDDGVVCNISSSKLRYVSYCSMKL